MKREGEGNVSLKIRVKGAFVITLALALLIFVINGNVAPVPSVISMTGWITLISYVWKRLEGWVTKGAALFDRAFGISMGLVAKVKERATTR